MKAAGGIALLLMVAASFAGWAQCDCGLPVEPICYETFKTNETIAFTVIAPIDYFMVHQTSVSPGIFGWRVETLEGDVVRTVIFPGDPKSRLTVMEWDLTDSTGAVVPPGYYNLIAMTTDSDVTQTVFVEPACQPCNSCFCGCYAPINPCCNPCRPEFGELYLNLEVGDVRDCGWLTFSITLTLECNLCGEEEP